MKIPLSLCLPALTLLLPSSSTLVVSSSCGSDTGGATYNVGPGQTYPTIGAAPLDLLLPGDWVCIYHDPSTGDSYDYKEKFVVNRQGTASQPIVISGVPYVDGTSGETKLPIIDGDGATTALYFDYWNEARNLIKIGAASYPSGSASYIRIQNLSLKHAHANYTYTSDNGATGQSYVDNAACIHIEQGSHIELVGNEISGCGNGIFIGGSVNDVLIESNYIHGNGNIGSIFEHNTYTEALRITYQYNRFGYLGVGCSGNNLKDRSAGLVVAHNFIEGGNRQLDLVDSSSQSTNVEYDTTYVYGNILVEPDDDPGNRQMIHFGGDSGNTAVYRDTLYLYHNTLLSTRTGRSTMLLLDGTTAYASNNIILAIDTATFGIELLANNGPSSSLIMKNNLISTGYVHYYFGDAPSNVVESGTIEWDATTSPLGQIFADPNYTTAPYDMHLVSSLLFATALEPGSPAITSEYVMHTSSQGRMDLDLGAYGYGAGGSALPSASPSKMPIGLPSASPSKTPTMLPSSPPTAALSASPSKMPTGLPSTAPSAGPTITSSASPTTMPITFDCASLASSGKDACNAASSTQGCFWCDANGNPTNSGKPANTCCGGSNPPPPTSPPPPTAPPPPTPPTNPPPPTTPSPTPANNPNTCDGNGAPKKASCSADDDCASCRCLNNGKCA